MDLTDQLSQFHVVTDAEADFEPSGNFKRLCQLNMEISSDNFTNTTINWERCSGNFTAINSDQEAKNSKESRPTALGTGSPVFETVNMLLLPVSFLH